MTAASGFAQSVRQMFGLRLGVGIGEATCAPAASSLIGDYFPSGKTCQSDVGFYARSARRTRSEFCRQRRGGETLRLAGGVFFVAGIPGLLCVFALFFIKEPLRGAAETVNVGTRRRSNSGS